MINCPDNKFIPRVNNAGTIAGAFQLMHNGLKVKTGGYYGKGITRMLAKNRGVHEPQEEYVFQEVLKNLGPQSVMVELGSYWSFYSMWFLKEIAKAQTYLYEPAKANLEIGKLNYHENNFTGDFNNAYIGGSVQPNDETPTLTVDHIIDDKGISYIDILHCDIQGHELEMLKGSANAIEKDQIGYFFISTHSAALHKNCLDFLTGKKYIIICEADLLNSYSVDGIIVARSKNYKGISPVNISHK